MSLDTVLLKRLQAVDTPTNCNAIEVAQNKRGFSNFTHQQMFCTEPDAPAAVGQTDHGAFIALAAAAGTEVLFSLLKQLLQPDVVHGVA